VREPGGANSTAGGGRRRSARRRAAQRLSRAGLTLAFGLLGALLVTFVALPLAAVVFGTPLAALWRILGDREVLASLWMTLSAAALATLLALATGVPLAYLLARYAFPGRRLVESIVSLPVVIPHTAAGVALLLVFGRYGPLGRLAETIGLAFTSTAAGVTVGMLFVSLPLLVSGAREAFAAVDPELERVALTEGADRWQAFWRVTLPLARRGITAAALLMWARGMSEFGAVVMLAYHPKTIPVLVYERFTGFGLDAAQPVALLVILAALALFVVIRLLGGSRAAGDGDEG
jgi:molybdate/tungstate transport system permease protein